MKKSLTLFTIAIIIAIILPQLWFGLDEGAIFPTNISNIIFMLDMLKMFFTAFIAPFILIALIIYSWFNNTKLYATCYTIINIFLVIYLWKVY